MATQKAPQAGRQMPESSGPTPPAESSTSTRKPWIKKTPIEIFLDQITKQEEKVADLRKALAQEERGLAKLQEARKVLEAK
ncbi:MAG: hypothetical protein ACLGSD_00390 [Acidobacteriota bacterium]